MIAEERSSYDDALEWYQKSLAIDEELGNRAGMANSYHQLGMIAEERGSYDDALEWYEKSMAIEEELGNRAGMASSYNQIGILFTKRGDSEVAIPYNLRSLFIRLEIKVRQITINLSWLAEQKNALGEEKFCEVVENEIGKEKATSVYEMMEK
jgi:tetratricopeptide (TPR) repeat protein